MIVKFHLEYIHVYMHQSVTKIVMKKENLCKLLFFKMHNGTAALCIHVVNLAIMMNCTCRYIHVCTYIKAYSLTLARMIL